ncbi:MAG: hypothetical protein ACLQO1_05465 [Steroidobacteraceae bacterium]
MGWLDVHNGAVTAVATIVIAAFTVFLVRVSNRQASLISDQIKLARDEFMATHRPRIRVRNLVINAPRFDMGFPISGQFFVSNIGGSTARIVESYSEVLWNVNSLPMERPYEGNEGNEAVPDDTIIEAGSSNRGKFGSKAPWGFDGIPGGEGPDGIRVFVLGWIEYIDESTMPIRRRTAFCREFQQRNGSARFYSVPDPDYEYEE